MDTTRLVRENRPARLSPSSMAISLLLLLSWHSTAASDPSCPPAAIVIPIGASIQAAVDDAAPFSRFCIGTGIHRGQSVVPKTGQQFHGEKGAVLNGARLVLEVERVGSLWAIRGLRDTLPKRGDCLRPPDVCHRSISIYADDKPLEQVAARFGLTPAQFFFDALTGTAFIKQNPSQKRIELSVARYAFHGTAADVMIKGLVIEKYHNPAQEGAVQGEEAVGWVVADSEIRLNNGAGVSVGSGGIISKSRIHHNGQLGATAGGTDITIEDSDVWQNNTYGFNPSWEAGGIKVTESSLVSFRRNRVRFNAGPGIWCDENCRDVIYEDNIVEFNAGAGIFFEISSGAVIRGNLLRENGQSRPSWFWGADIQIAASNMVDISGNTIIAAYDGKAIMLIDQNRQRRGGGYYETRDVRVHHNDVTFLGPGSVGGVSDAKPGAKNYSVIEQGNNIFDHNSYNSRSSNSPVFVWGHNTLDYEGFRQAGQERNGSRVRESHRFE